MIEYLDKFLNKVNKTDSCWLWEGPTDRDGYGLFNPKWKLGFRAHRYILQALGHNIKGKVVCHKCDVPNCVNPDHLFVGTQADNMKDMFAKKRNRPRYSKVAR